MANDLNQCNFIGRLGKDPESKFTAAGMQVTQFSMAVGRKYKDTDETEWVRVTAFGKLAEICSQYLTKGSKVFISGRMKTDKWTDQNGQDRYTTGVIAENMQMLDSRNDSPQQSAPAPQQPAPQRQAAPPPPPAMDDFSDDIPF